VEAQWAKQEVIPVSKRTYRATSVNDVNAEELTKQLRRDERVIVAVDVYPFRAVKSWILPITYKFALAYFSRA
jgi:hypothetical protein